MTCSGIEVVITSTIGNRVAVKSGPRVRIPPAAPKNKPTLDAVSAKLTASVVSGFFIPPFFNSGKKDVNDHFHPSYWIRTRRTAH